MPADDRERVARCAAWAAWFERTYRCPLEDALDWLLDGALRLTRSNRYAAEDLAQSTTERLLTATPKSIPDEPESYIMGALKNQFLDEGRRNHASRRGGGIPPQPLHDVPEPAASEAGPEETALTQETRMTLLEAIQKLPERERVVVELALDYVSLGLDFRSRKEIAEELGIPEGTVRRRLHDGIRHLRELLRGPEEGRDE